MKKLKEYIYYKVILLLICFISLVGNSQIERNYWYFGENAGINFSSGEAVALTDGMIFTNEGTSAISDDSGSLLFYTDGITVWDQNHNEMPNGTGLNGDESSTQSALIIPLPGSDSKYYLFTTPLGVEDAGLQYSEIDMTLNGGLGDITANKNIQLTDSVCEKVTSVKHANGTDYWVITHKWNSNQFIAYLISSNGITTEVQSNVGTVVYTPMGAGFANSIGYLKSSINNDKIAIANKALNVEIFDFNNANGLLSNPITIDGSEFSLFGSYGVEFSPNGNLLYVTEMGLEKNIYQFNLKAGSEMDIVNSKTIIGNNVSPGNALQIGPDCKIYVSEFNHSSLGIIQNPNTLGVNCNYQSGQISLEDRNSRLGLPNFANYCTDSAAFNANSFCYNTPTEFSSVSENQDSLVWNFDDPVTGLSNYSTLSNPSHTFSDTGVFQVSLIAFYHCYSDTSYKLINIKGSKTNLGNDTSICNDIAVTLNATHQNATYQWSTAETSSTIEVMDSGIYWVDVTVNNCVERDSIKVIDLIAAEIGNDTVICSGDEYVLDVTTSGASYLWSSGDITPTLSIDSSDAYWVEIQVGQCVERDTITIEVFGIYLGEDTILCENENIVLDPMVLADSYLWQDQASNPTYLVTEQGMYWLEATLGNCTQKDSIRITKSKLALSLGPDSVICIGETIELNPGLENLDYFWQDGSTDSSYVVSEEGLYSLQISNGCDIVEDTIIIATEDCWCTLYVPNAYSPNGDGINDAFQPSFSCEIIEFEMFIYNRWGNIIFETNDPLNPWDGLYLNAQVPEGLYGWFMSYKGKHERINENLHGSVSLIH